jgi:hypothetical protein
MHRTRATLPVIATLSCSRKRNRFAEAIQQRGARIDVQFVLLAINPQREGNGARGIGRIRF